MRPTIITAILLLWLGSLLALFYQPSAVEQAQPQSISTAPEEADEWWGIYMQGHKVGFTRHHLQEAPQGLVFEEESLLRLTTLGEKQVVRTAVFGLMTKSFELRNIELTLTAGPTNLRVQAAMRDGDLWVTVGPEGENPATKLNLVGPLSLSMGLRKQAMRAPLEAGRIARGMVFDPLTRTSSPLTLTVAQPEPLPGGSGAVAWRIVEEWRDVKSVLWVDDHGRLLREEGPLGLLAIREDKTKAMATADADSGWDAVDAVSIPVDPPIENPRTRDTLHVRLSGIAAERIPSGEGQTVKGTDLLIRRARLDQLNSYRLPYNGGDHPRELEATEALQVDDPRIITLAETILGSQRDALAATQQLVDWVYRYLKKIPTATLPNALEILDSGQGDCNEHAVLFTALARAAGIPSRVVNGTVYAERAFLYHAWSEVWLGRWVAVDAALNQTPADATHIRLTAGDGDEHVLMMSILGNLRIEVLGDGDGST